MNEFVAERKLPTRKELEEELDRVNKGIDFRRVVRNTIYLLIVVAAVAVLVAVLLLPVLRIYGQSMTPGLEDGDIIFTIKTSNFESGDVIAFYYNNKVLVKRVIAIQGEWVDIDENGNVFVNGILLDEPYVSGKAFGECDIELPYQVPEGRIFVMGDHRDVSVDSRTTAVGCVSEEQIVGKLVLRVWPLKRIGLIQ